KDPPLDQTGDPNDKKKEVSRHQLALPLKKQPRLQADLQQGLNLDKALPAAQGDAQSWISDLAKQADARSLTELEYHLEEVYKATTDQLDWVNPEGQQYPHNLLQPLPLIPNNQSRRVIPFEYFINNDLEYLRG
nr:hypothetical protein [Tanacetum cinerariifolium]